MIRKRPKSDFYDEDGTEYCFDGLGRRLEVGPSFKDVPMGARFISCPICRACKHEKYDENSNRYCELKGQIPDAIENQEVFECDGFEGDPEEFSYDLVMKVMENGGPLE